MRQFILPHQPSGEGLMRLDGNDYHYLCNVLRLKREDSFPAIDADGSHYHCTIEQVQAKSVLVRVLPRGGPEDDLFRITLYQCLPKARKLDEVIRKCTEAGVSKIIPVVSDHSVVRIDSGQGPARQSRWQRIAREAVQQSGSPTPVQVHEPVSVDELGSFEEPDSLRLFLHQEPLEQQTLHRYLAASPSRVSIVVGPEGGLSTREVRLLQGKGFLPVYLGPYVLRTETAALYAVAAIRTIQLERRSWMPT